MNKKLQTLLTLPIISFMLALPLASYANELSTPEAPLVSADETNMQTLSAEELEQVQMSCREGAIDAEIPAEELELAISECIHESSLIDPYIDDITESEGEDNYMDEASVEDESADISDEGSAEASE